MSDFRNKFLENLLTFNFKLERYFYRHYFSKLPSNNLKILKDYLFNDHLIRESFIAKYGIDFFDGLHPKNVFNYRSEFFLQNVEEKDIVVDIACGTGLILNKISYKIKKGYGVDYDKVAIDLCITKHKRENLDFFVGDILKFNYKKFKDETKYNVAIFSHLLEHIEDPVKLLNAVNADKVLICVPSQENWITRLRIHLNLPFKKDDSHFREYTRAELVNELISANYFVNSIGFNSEGEIICSATKSSESGSIVQTGTPRLSYAGIYKDNNLGGKGKLEYLQGVFPENFSDFNILYLLSAASSYEVPNIKDWINMCKEKGVKIVLNQNGVAYPAYHQNDWEEIDEKMSFVLKNADFVIYQSEFAKRAADKFLGSSKSFKVLHNPVDISQFRLDRDKESDLNKEVRLLTAGIFNQKERLTVSVDCLAKLRQDGINAKLILAGRLNWIPDSSLCLSDSEKYIAERELTKYVEIRGEYSKDEAKDIFQRSDILLHTQYNDVCPSLVLEAMACGLPVVYSNSGGTPELVGSDAGVGVKSEENWNKVVWPDPELLSESVKKVIKNYSTYSQNARRRVESNFGVKDWIKNHDTIFKSLLKHE